MIPDTLQSVVTATLKNLLEKEKCKKALVVSGLQENVDDPRQSAADIESAKDILKNCNGDPAGIKCVYRMGEIQTEPAIPLQGKKRKYRLLKIDLKSAHDQSVVIRHAKNLRNVNGYDGVFVNPSRTIEERRKIAQLLQEMKERKRSGENLYLDYFNLTLKEDKKKDKIPMSNNINMANK